MTVKVIADRGAGRLLGVQIVGRDGRGEADRHRGRSRCGAS